MNSPDLAAYKAAREAIEKDPVAADVRKVIEQFNRGVLTEYDVIQALGGLTPHEWFVVSRLVKAQIVGTLVHNPAMLEEAQAILNKAGVK